MKPSNSIDIDIDISSSRVCDKRVRHEEWYHGIDDISPLVGRETSPSPSPRPFSSLPHGQVKVFRYYDSDPRGIVVT
jgi:hypothetical protein